MIPDLSIPLHHRDHTTTLHHTVILATYKVKINLIASIGLSIRLNSSDNIKKIENAGIRKCKTGENHVRERIKESK